MQNTMYHLGVDIGGTKTTVGIFDREFGVAEMTTIPTESQNGCQDLVRRIGDCFRALLKQKGLAITDIISAGVASPGPLNLKTGRIVHIPTMGFRDEPIREYLEKELGMSVSLENDTNAAALCESVLGGGRGYETVAYVTISTGIGCGLAYKGRILDGGSDAAGELGHLKVERGGRRCACGGEGCLEMYASGTSIAAIASERLGECLDARQVFQNARAGGKVEKQVIAEAADYLGYGIAALYQLLDPDIVILGGSVTRDYEVFQEDLKKAIGRYTQYVPGREICIVVSEYDGSQVVIGAAYYGAQQANVLFCPKDI